MVGYSFLDDSFIRNPMPVYPGAIQPCRPLRRSISIPHTSCRAESLRVTCGRRSGCLGLSPEFI